MESDDGGGVRDLKYLCITNTMSLFKPAATLDDDEYLFVPAGDQYGEGWWGDRWKDVKSVAKKVQSSQAVRDIEKGAVDVGSKALRGVLEPAADAVADAGVSLVGMPELAPLIDAGIHKGARALQKKGARYLDQKIDASGKGRVRYMSPSGGGMRLAGSGTQLGSGMRLAGSGMRLAGSGGGLRLAGSGMYVPAGRHGLLEGSGHACSCGA